MIDHTLLKPETTDDDVTRLCQEASLLGVGRLHISIRLHSLPAPYAGNRGGSGRRLPIRRTSTAVKVVEAAIAVAAGANEIDMVIDLGAACASQWTW